MAGLTSDPESGAENIDTAGEKSRDNHVVDWDGADDPKNPLNWPSFNRHMHIVLVSIFTLYGYCCCPKSKSCVPLLIVG